MLEKLALLEKTHAELTAKLADPEVLADRKAYTEASKKLSEIAHVVGLYREHSRLARQKKVSSSRQRCSTRWEITCHSSPMTSGGLACRKNSS